MASFADFANSDLLRPYLLFISVKADSAVWEYAIAWPGSTTLECSLSGAFVQMVSRLAQLTPVESGSSLHAFSDSVGSISVPLA